MRRRNGIVDAHATDYRPQNASWHFAYLPQVPWDKPAEALSGSRLIADAVNIAGSARMRFDVSPPRFPGLRFRLSLSEGSHDLGLRVRARVFGSAVCSLFMFEELGAWAFERGVKCQILQASSREEYRFTLWLEDDVVAAEFLLAWVFDDAASASDQMIEWRRKFAALRKRTSRLVHDATQLKRTLMLAVSPSRPSVGEGPFWQQSI